MPREIVHWIVLERTIESLDKQETPKLYALLRGATVYKNLSAAYLGAMSHDAPYYYGGAFESLAQRLHGKEGEDTLQPMSDLLNQAAKTAGPERSILYSFILGMLSHVATDVTFHPMVYYFTGDYYDADPKERDRAQERHRAFETYLDCSLRHIPRRQQVNDSASYLLQPHLEILGSDREGIYQLLESVLSHPSGPKWGAAIEKMAKFQGYFRSEFFGIFAFVANKLLFGKYSSKEVLFNYRRRDGLEEFSSILEFKNPVSGEPCEASVEELIEEASAKCLSYFSSLEPFFSGKQSDAQLILSLFEACSLNFGLPSTCSKDIKHSDCTKFELL